jgi:hypothetical protein
MTVMMIIFTNAENLIINSAASNRSRIKTEKESVSRFVKQTLFLSGNECHETDKHMYLNGTKI